MWGFISYISRFFVLMSNFQILFCLVKLIELIIRSSVVYNKTRLGIEQLSTRGMQDAEVCCE